MGTVQIPWELSNVRRWPTLCVPGNRAVVYAMQSPCNQTCRIDDHTGYCIGCGRDLDEIAEWPDAPEIRQQQILSALPPRMAAMTAARVGDTVLGDALARPGLRT